MDKLKVLIVDDEYLIRNLIKMRMDWEGRGMTIVGEAASAHEALDLVDQWRPDIILTDIYMPSMNGIEFSGMVLAKYPHIKIVIVTGHDEFEYARKSIQLGISDFILKPIRAAELLQVTDKLKRKIEEERMRDHELKRLKEDLERNFPFLKEKFLIQWITGALSLEEIQEKAAYFGFPLHQASSFQMAVIEISPISETMSEEQLLLLQMEGKNRANAFFQDDSGVFMLSDARNHIVVIAMDRDADFVSECVRLQSNLLHSCRCVVNIGIGRTHHKAQEMSLGYQEAARALQYKTFVGHNQVVCFEDIVDNGGSPYRSNPELLKQLQFDVSVGSSERALGVMRDIFDVSFSGVSQFRMAAMDIITACQHAAIEQQVEHDYAFHKETLDTVLTADNLPEFKTALENYVGQLASTVYAKNEAKEGNLISRMKAYLEENMSDPKLGLASASAAFFVSPGHLGRLMKKETGQTFVEYLTNLRMKKAEALLKKTDLRGYEVGEKVGITDPHYFSILFKKNIGRSVNEYRNLRG
ncbi:two-component system response regulator YesN [Paenibacillus phyllosphaerae]|uniref:Two-component system response regulator YesN n=1 Tax=Paenibacillus phyllosphaerae TaxID=274593 RepID=A0A7W5FKH7_9BACL|nr:response regulator [Paenibacillus phyllosphaerae]MBB3108058.1 two-component system response regulator YesN [Paenibacillus phyllosphaerae]